LFRFNDIRFQGATTVLYRNAVSISTGYDGTPLEFAASEPRSGTDDRYLFVAGGGKLEKVDVGGVATAQSYTATTIAFVASTPATITDSANQFVIEGFVAGQHLNVSGPNSVTGSYRIDTVTAGTITLEARFTLTAVAAGVSVTLTGIPSVTKWGIAAPTAVEMGAPGAPGSPAPVVAVTQAPQKKVIDDADVLTGGTPSISSRVVTASVRGEQPVKPTASLRPDSSDKVEGTASMAISHTEMRGQADGRQRAITQSTIFDTGLDLTVHDGGDTSPDQDQIIFNLKMSNQIVSFLERINVEFINNNGVDRASFTVGFSPNPPTDTGGTGDSGGDTGDSAGNP
jgi:hypothetical protein